MLPSFICIQWVQDCVAAAGNDLQSLTDCRSVECGNKSAANVPTNNGGSASSSSSATSSATGTASKTGSGTKQTSTSTGAAIALNVGKSYGTGLLGAGLLAIFGLAL